MKRCCVRLVVVLLSWLLAVGPAMAQSRGPVVLAAASLQESLTMAADRWAAKGHARPVLSFAASSALARQIMAGAPADLFFSADEEWMDAVAAKGGLRRGTRQAVLTNRLVLIAPADSTLRLAIRPGFALARALGTGRLAMADPDSVPAGRYGKQALDRLGVWPTVQDRLTRSDNVRAALALVVRREVPLGITYSTDAMAAPGVRIVGIFPATSHHAITYPVAVLARSTHPDAQGFRTFLVSAEGRAIFRRFGFGTR